MATIDITGLDPIEVFRQLYNNSRPQGMGYLHYVPGPMNYEEAKEIFNASVGRDGYSFFDYVKGRVMKVHISDTEVCRADLYDRDNGPGRCQRVIDQCILDA